MLKDIVQAIRSWAKDIPQRIVTIQEEQLEFEHIVSLTPTKPRACSVEFRVSHYGTFGLYFGTGFAFEDIPSSINLVLDICKSIRQGNVQKEVWEMKGKVIKTKGVLKLSTHPDLHDSGCTSWRVVLPAGSQRSVQYEPWD